MKPRLLLAAATLLALLAIGGAGANPLPPEVRNGLPNATLAGASRFSYFGFDVYDASLWVMPGFSAVDYDRHGFALALTYLRDFTGESIAKRSVTEMRRQSGVTEAQLTAWDKLMASTFPDVRKGDRLTGIHRPGEGAVFLLNGRPAGTIQEAEFSRRFFGIWLSTQTSNTRLREALTGHAVAR
jgi:Chalcone isomerase-like